MDRIKFAQRIKEARRKQGITQKELAEKLQVTDKAVSKWERALSFPDIELLGSISKELQIPLAELLDVEELAVDTEKEKNLETVLEELLVIMKDRMQAELRRRKRWLTAAAALFLTLSLLLGAYEVYAAVTFHAQMNAYRESAYTLSCEELRIHVQEEADGKVFLSLAVPEEISSRYEVYQRCWYDREDPATACIQLFYYGKSAPEELPGLFHRWEESDPVPTSFPDQEVSGLTEEREETIHDWESGFSEKQLKRCYVLTGAQTYEEPDIDGYGCFFNSRSFQSQGGFCERDMDLPVNRIVYRAGGEPDSSDQDVVLWERL